MARCAAPAFEEFLGLSNFELVNRNIASSKHYASLYSAFTRQVAVKEEYGRKLLDSDYMRTFYSEQEIAAAEAKWLTRHD